MTTERTLLSISGINYGHYKASDKFKKLIRFLAKKVMLVSRMVCSPERWSYGLMLILEKITGLALVNKLRAILLMGVDFNMHKKMIFGQRMMEKARWLGAVSE